jgi:hypothetical protein
MKLLRTIYILVKNLPSYFLFKNNKNNNIEFNYRLLSKTSYQKNFDSIFKINSKEFNNFLFIEYVSEKDIKNLENNNYFEKFKNKNNINKINIYKNNFEKNKNENNRKISLHSNNLSNVLNDSKLSNDASFEFEILNDDDF